MIKVRVSMESCVAVYDPEWTGEKDRPWRVVSTPRYQKYEYWHESQHLSDLQVSTWNLVWSKEEVDVRFLVWLFRCFSYAVMQHRKVRKMQGRRP